MSASQQLPLGQSIRVLLASSRAYWIVNLANFGDGIAYFGILTLLTRFLGTRLGMSDPMAGLTVSLYTGLVTLFMLNGGRISDQLGVRRAITWSLATCALGRALLAASPSLGGSALSGQFLAWVALGLMAYGTGILQPALYAGVKEYTDERTSSVGWSLLYSIMNLGIVAAEFVSPFLRTDATFVLGVRGLNLGIEGVFLFLAGLTAGLWMVNLVLFTSEVEERERVTAPDPARHASTRGFFAGLGLALGCGLAMGVVIYDTTRHPALWKAVGPALLLLGAGFLFRYLRGLESRFAFFIFILVPVRTLFAHQWLTLPDYVFRCFDASVGERFEWISMLNPAIVTVAVPLIAAATLRFRVIDVMIVGTALSALTTFLLVLPPQLSLLLAYVAVFSLGEAIWASRFLEYVSALAPPGQTGAYMGVANLPWFLAKFTTGIYSGAMLAHFVPAGPGPKNPQAMWLIYGIFTLVSPLGLILGRRWILQAQSRSPAATGEENGHKQA